MTDKEKLEKLKKLADAMYYATQYLTTDASRLHKAMDEYHKFIIHECKKEPVSEDLEEAATLYAKEEYSRKNPATLPDMCIGCYAPIIYAFRNGAKWQKAKDESTTEDLSEYINKLFKQFPEVSFAKLSRIAVRVAKWQKEQFEKNRLAACDRQTEEEAEREQDFVMGIIENKHRQPTFDDAIKYGMRFYKKQIMEEAIDVEVKMDAGGYPYIPQLELYDYDKDVPLAKEGDKYKVLLIKGNKYGNSRKATI